MADLREFLEQLGFEEPRSLLQSGNLIFRSRKRDGAAIERLLELEAAKRLRLDTAFFVRTVSEWARIVAANPFTGEARRDPAHLAVMFLKEPPAPDRIRTLQDAITGPEILSAVGRQLYVVYPAGFARTRLTGALIDRTLGSRSTGRNWNTVLKLATLAGV